MDQRRSLVLLVLLYLIAVIHVGQSLAEKSKYDKCYISCMKTCFLTSFGNSRLITGCSMCDDHCQRKVEGKACLLFWCWNQKVRQWKFISFWYWELLIILERTQKTLRKRRISHCPSRIKSFDVPIFNTNE